MHCVKCGAEVAPGSAFCATCGATVTDPGAATLLVATAEEQDQLLVQLRRDLAKDYEVEKELGRGGMAVVYQAREIELRRLVALKVLPPGMGSADMAERFRREARMAAALDHANIIPIYRVGQAAGTYFFAMKFVEGRAVDAILEQQGPLPVPVILQILRATASALAFAHERQIVHRDIKGANILVDRDGRVLVSDFGIARAAEEKTLTASGSIIGTPHFMSPEQCSGQKVGPQSDQYSLGILAFQMLTGQVPFDADSVIAIIQHHYFTPVPDVRTVREGVPEELLGVVSRALAKDAAQRYETTREMVKALETVPFSAEERAQAEDTLRDLARGEAIPRVRTGSLPPLADTRTIGAAALAQAAPTVTAAPLGARAGAHRRGRGARLAAVGIAGVAVVAGGVWLATRSGTSGPPGVDSLATAGPTQMAAGQAAAQPGQAAGLPLPAAPGPSGTPARAQLRGDSVAARGGPPVRAPAGGERAAAPAAPARQAVAPPPSQPAAPAATGLLRVRTVPPNAQIAVDGRRVGDPGSAFDVEVPAGVRRLRISAPGYVTFDTTITVETGGTVRLGTKTLRSEGGP
jgi:predicted Ser/Thr protein kinase